MKFYDKEIYNRNEKIKAVIVIIIPFLIGFIVGCFTMNIEAQAKIDNLNKLIEEKENKINEQYVELDSLRETVYMYELNGR